MSLLWATGQTVNIMTLGGLALAVGVLVDEATVEIENIHTQMRSGISRARGVVNAASQTAIARLLSMLCVLAVFVPSFFMTGVARQLFVPLWLAVGQVMSFGSPTPIEVAVLGGDLQNDYKFAQQIQIQMAGLPFLRDLQISQEVNYPTMDIKIDRERAGQFGLTMADVTRSVVPATSSSRFTEPNYWRDPNSGNAFQIQVEPSWRCWAICMPAIR